MTKQNLPQEGKVGSTYANWYNTSYISRIWQGEGTHVIILIDKEKGFDKI